MINFRLDRSSVSDLLELVQGKYPLSEDLALQICDGSNPVTPRTQVYGVYKEGLELVSIMTATYLIVFPNADGSRVVHISGAYTKESERHKKYAASLLAAIEKDAVEHFGADYLCGDSTADELYEKNGFEKTPEKETRLWKRLKNTGEKSLHEEVGA